jgi:hypothetical protein
VDVGAVLAQQDLTTMQLTLRWRQKHPAWLPPDTWGSLPWKVHARNLRDLNTTNLWTNDFAGTGIVVDSFNIRGYYSDMSSNPGGYELLLNTWLHNGKALYVEIEPWGHTEGDAAGEKLTLILVSRVHFPLVNSAWGNMLNNSLSLRRSPTQQSWIGVYTQPGGIFPSQNVSSLFWSTLLEDQAILTKETPFLLPVGYDAAGSSYGQVSQIKWAFSAYAPPTYAVAFITDENLESLPDAEREKAVDMIRAYEGWGDEHDPTGGHFNWIRIEYDYDAEHWQAYPRGHWSTTVNGKFRNKGFFAQIVTGGGSQVFHCNRLPRDVLIEMRQLEMWTACNFPTTPTLTSEGTIEYKWFASGSSGAQTYDELVDVATGTLGHSALINEGIGMSVILEGLQNVSPPSSDKSMTKALNEPDRLSNPVFCKTVGAGYAMPLCGHWYLEGYAATEQGAVAAVRFLVYVDSNSSTRYSIAMESITMHIESTSVNSDGQTEVVVGSEAGVQLSQVGTPVAFEHDHSVANYAPLCDIKGSSNAYSGSALSFDNYGNPVRLTEDLATYHFSFAEGQVAPNATAGHARATWTRVDVTGMYAALGAVHYGRPWG